MIHVVFRIKQSKEQRDWWARLVGTVPATLIHPTVDRRVVGLVLSGEWSQAQIAPHVAAHGNTRPSNSFHEYHVFLQHRP